VIPERIIFVSRAVTVYITSGYSRVFLTSYRMRLHVPDIMLNSLKHFFFFTVLPWILILSKFYYQLMHKRIALKGVLKFTFTMLKTVNWNTWMWLIWWCGCICYQVLAGVCLLYSAADIHQQAICHMIEFLVFPYKSINPNLMCRVSGCRGQLHATGRAHSFVIIYFEESFDRYCV